MEEKEVLELIKGYAKHCGDLLIGEPQVAKVGQQLFLSKPWHPGYGGWVYHYTIMGYDPPLAWGKGGCGGTPVPITIIRAFRLGFHI